MGYGDGDEATVVAFVDADPAQAGVQKNATTFFRTDFTVTDPAAFERLRLTVTYDDAVAVYLNGTEVLRSDNLPVTAGFADYANGQVPDNTVQTREDLLATLLRAGGNAMAVEVHQSDAGSSDLSLDLTLDGLVSGSGEAHTLEPFFFTRPTGFKARSREGADWSALTEGHFLPDVVGATLNHLVISEFCYRPADPATPAEQALTSDRDEFEYLEIMNITAQAVDLTGVAFTAGILFEFPAGTTLGGGERLVVARNQSAFEARFGTGPRVVGTYDGNLANGGEEIALVDAQGLDLRRFHYLDRSPWPPGPNRNGYSLVLRRPETAPDHRDPTQWRTSVLPGGSPGGGDAISFAGVATADANGNGQADLLDHALGVLLIAPGEGVGIAVESFPNAGEAADHLVVSYPRNLAADDALVVLEVAADPAGPWQREPERWVLLREERKAGSTVRQSLRLDPALGSTTAIFIRLSVQLGP